MVSPINLKSAESVGILQARRLSNEQQGDFAALLDQAHEQLEEQDSAKEVLSGMSSENLNLIREAAGLVDRIHVSTLSEEGATNLLAGAGHSGLVDLNHDGLVEVGAAKMITFPPVDAPDAVHQAWEEASADLSDSDRITMQLHMHTMAFGIRIHDQPTKPALAPEQQWSTGGFQNLMSDARAGLEFAVGREGWNEHNRMMEELYDRFDKAMASRNDDWDASVETIAETDDFEELD